MSVFVIAVTDPGSYYLSPGESVPDHVGAYVERFTSEREAHAWILSPERPIYSTESGECPLLVVNAKGVVI